MFKHVFTLNPVPVAFMLKQLQTGIRVQISDSYFTDIEHYSKFYIVLIKGHGYPSTMATFSSTLPCFSNLPWKGQIFAKWRQLMPSCKGATDVRVHSPVTHLLHPVQLVHLVHLVQLVHLVHLVQLVQLVQLNLVMGHRLLPFISKGPMAIVTLTVPLARLNGSDRGISNLTWPEEMEGSLPSLQPKFWGLNFEESWRGKMEILSQRSEAPC